ncbi:MAG TPA: hypothetical protein VF657_00320 [Actinoplanes sp.]
MNDVHTVAVRGTTMSEDSGAVGTASLAMSSKVSARSDRLLLPR